MTQISNATWQQIGQPRQLGIWTNSISHREPSDGTPIRSTVHIQFHWWNYHYINPMSGLGFSQISASLSSHRSRVSRVSLELSISRRWGTPTFGTLIRRTTVLDLGLGECSDLQFFVFLCNSLCMLSFFLLSYPIRWWIMAILAICCYCWCCWMVL